MAAYRRFDLDKRITLQKNLSDGLSFAKIADELGMSAFSLSRVVHRISPLPNHSDRSQSISCTEWIPS